jgi:hypothetical protein
MLVDFYPLGLTNPERIVYLLRASGGTEGHAVADLFVQSMSAAEPPPPPPPEEEPIVLSSGSTLAQICAAID